MFEKIRKWEVKVYESCTLEFELSIKDIEDKMNIQFPFDYKQFIQEFGFIRIMSGVMVKSLSPLPNVSVDDNFVSIGRFLNWGFNDFSIKHALETYEEQFPEKFIPIAEGESGDFIGFYFKNKYDYNICYWFHEAWIVKDLTIISHNFNDLIHSIEEHEIDLGDFDPSKVKNSGPSPKMIELLKKTGMWRGEQ